MNKKTKFVGKAVEIMKYMMVQFVFVCPDTTTFNHNVQNVSLLKDSIQYHRHVNQYVLQTKPTLMVFVVVSRIIIVQIKYVFYAQTINTFLLSIRFASLNVLTNKFTLLNLIYAFVLQDSFARTTIVICALKTLHIMHKHQHVT